MSPQAAIFIIDLVFFLVVILLLMGVSQLDTFIKNKVYGKGNKK